MSNTANFIDYNRKQYLIQFTQNLSKKKIENKREEEINKMSLKKPIPIDDYDYCNFNFISNNHKEIFIKDFFTKAEKNFRYNNKYLIGKIISDVYYDEFFYFLIEDKNKDIIAISIFHFEKNFYPINIENLEKTYLSIGKHILFINPWFTFEHYYEIVSLTTNEFIIFDDFGSLNSFINENNNIKTSNDYKKLGDYMIKKKLYLKAIFYYEKAININNNENELIKIYSNLALAFLNYGYYTKSIKYCDMAFELLSKIILNKNTTNVILNDCVDNIKPKIFYRKLMSLYKFRKFIQCLNHISKYKNDSTIIKLINNNENIQEIIKDIEIKKTNELGVFNFSEMLLDENKNFYLNNPDYISNKIEITYDNIKGLKIKTKSKISKGELILVEKAIVSKKYENSVERRKKLELGLSELSSKKESPTENLEVIDQLIEKINKYPEDNEIFFMLYDETNKNENMQQRKNNKKKTIINFRSVFDSNKYTASRNFLFSNQKGFGLWGIASIFNHSCNANINTFTIGDMMICFAVKNIEKDEELYTMYTPNTNSYITRKEKCQYNWGFDCTCDLCLYDKNKLYNNQNIIEMKNKNYFEKKLETFYDFGYDIYLHRKYNKDFENFENFLNNNKNEMIWFELANGYFVLLIHNAVMNNYEYCLKISNLIHEECLKGSCYAIELETLNVIYNCFCRYNSDAKMKDKIFDIIIKRYRKLFKENSNFTEEDITLLVKLTL